MREKETKQPEKKVMLEMWQRRLEKNKLKYDEQLACMQQREEIYNGTSKVDAAYGQADEAKRRAVNVYNIAYELIEGQVDSTLPLPRVRTSNPEAVDQAMQVEEMLRAKMEQLPFEEMNDMDERNTYNQGADFALVEWDSTESTHSTVGNLAVSIVHPRQVIPQDGVLELAEMDYFFVQSRVTRAFVKRRYGKEVEHHKKGDWMNPKAEKEELVDLNTAYFKNKKNGVGRFVWAGDTLLEELEDYQARMLWRCSACKQVSGGYKQGEKHLCETCAGTNFYKSEEEFEELQQPVVRSDGSVIPAQQPVLGPLGQPLEEMLQNPDGTLQRDETGNPVRMPAMRRTRIPYYKPGAYPLVMRRNVSKSGSFLGGSDIDVVRPQQDAIKKLTSNMMEKLLKGGSYVTLPSGVKVETSDRQLKILRVDNPAQKSLIDVLNIQPNINFDMAALRDQYEKARQVLGITDSYQGKRDTTAISGVAKQFAAAQTAGRLESKRRMKNAFYEKLYRSMFTFMLAYADEPVRFLARNERGEEVFAQFNRYDFLHQDEAGEYYWDDEFLFSVDATGALAQNREAMWNEAEKKYASGALGEPNRVETRILYWSLLEQLQFPMAKAVKQSLVEEKQAENEAVQNQMQDAVGQQEWGLDGDVT